MDYCKIGKYQAISLILILILNHLILNIPQNMYEISGNSILLNIIWISFIMILFTFIVIKLFKNFAGQDLLDIANFVCGKKLQVIVGILFIIFFILNSSFLLRNFVEDIRSIYYIQIPTWILCILMLSIGIISNRLGENTVCKYNSIIVFIMLISIVLVLLTAIPYYSTKNVYPLLGNGINATFLNGLSNIYAFSGFSFLYFIIPILKSTKDFKKVGISSVIVGSIYIFFAMLTFLFSFTFSIPTNGSSPLYLVLLSAELGRFFQRPAALFILTWILSIMSFLSVIIMFCSIILKKMCNIKNSSSLSYIWGSLLYIFALIPSNLVIIHDLEDTVYRYFTIILVFIFVPLLLIIANIKHKYFNKGGT